jgi:hypothetical protein
MVNGLSNQSFSPQQHGLVLSNGGDTLMIIKFPLWLNTGLFRLNTMQKPLEKSKQSGRTPHSTSVSHPPKEQPEKS